MSKKNNIAITYNNEIVNLSIFPNDFQLMELEIWIRSRFDILLNDKIVYLDLNGDGKANIDPYICTISILLINYILNLECLPSKLYFKTNSNLTILKKMQVEDKMVINNTPHHEEIPQKNKTSMFQFLYSYFPVAWIILAVLIYYLKFDSHTSSQLLDYFKHFEEKLIILGIILKKGIILDSFISFISWPVTYLFVRRLLNPETSKDCFKKYGVDTFYGGAAAACNVILKGILTTCLVQASN